jgi:hypothetical protein
VASAIEQFSIEMQILNSPSTFAIPMGVSCRWIYLSSKGATMAITTVILNIVMLNQRRITTVSSNDLEARLRY